METFKSGDWFITDHIDHPQQVIRVDENDRIVFEHDTGAIDHVNVFFARKVPSPYPRLERTAQRKVEWAEEPMTFDDLMKKALSVFPDAYVEEQFGELVVRTGYREQGHGKPLVKIESE